MSRIKLLLVILLFVLRTEMSDTLIADQGPVLGKSPLITSEKQNDSLDRYWKILVKTPKSGPVFDQVWKAYADKGEVNVLVARCRKLVVQSPESISCRLLEGLVLARQAAHAEALESWQRASELDPNDVRPFLYRGELLLSDGNLSQAAAELQQAARRKAGPVEQRQIFQLLIRAHVRQNDMQKVQEVCRRYEKVFPDELEAKLHVAEILTGEGKFSEALDRYEQLIRLCRADDESRLRYTFEATGLMTRLGRLQDAITTLKTVANVLTEDHWLTGPVQARLEELYRQSGDDAGLARYYESRLVKHPRETETLRRLALLYIQLGRNGDAQRLLEKSLVPAESSVPLRLVLIDLLAGQGDLSAVDLQCREVLRFAARDSDIVERLGLAILRCETVSGKSAREKAVQCWELLLKEHEHDTRRINRLARLLETHGFGDAAMKYYHRAVELDKDSPSACMTLADKLLEHKQYEEAIELCDRVRKQSPDAFDEYFTSEMQLKLLSLFETNETGQKTDVSRLTAIFRDVPSENLLLLYKREMLLRKFGLARRALEFIRPDTVIPWEYLYRQGELAACLGKETDSRACFERLRQMRLPDDASCFSRTSAFTMDEARRVLAFSVKTEKGSLSVPDCFRGITSADALALFATVFSDTLSGL
ncbi:MAG: tetratricopeptide repeat protein, partial [Thermoguttaceae bacterium]|nr:tetratricopeptide repeat protein [Thermoguttaceae bacterium]